VLTTVLKIVLDCSKLPRYRGPRLLASLKVPSDLAFFSAHSH